MQQKEKNRGWKILLAGITSGFLNGLFGSGGGVVAVMFLRSLIGDEKKAHASATLMILAMSLISFALYAAYGEVLWKEGLMFVPGGVIGAIVGSALLKNMGSQLLRRIFGGVLAVSGVVMLVL